LSFKGAATNALDAAPWGIIPAKAVIIYHYDISLIYIDILKLIIRIYKPKKLKKMQIFATAIKKKEN
jgi:hypothetical protein